MVQTDLKSDNFCGYNTSAAPFFWILDPVQNHPQYSAGEVGINASVGLHTPAEVIKVSNFLSDRGNYLTSCVPPVPPMLSPEANASDASIANDDDNLRLPTQGLDDNATDLQPLQGAKFKSFPSYSNKSNNNNNLQREDYVTTVNDDKYYKNKKVMSADGSVRGQLVDTASFLLGETTSVKRSGKDYSNVDFHGGFSGNIGNLYSNPQDLTHVIERMWLERGGLDQNQLIKQSQEYFVPSKPTKEGTRTPIPPKNINGKREKQSTCSKIRQPYSIEYPFGLPTDENTGKPIPAKHSVPFNAIDVASVGISSPVFDQDPDIIYNYDAEYSNGGCNNVFFLEDNLMCQNQDNDLTGVNKYSFKYDMPPPGLYPINKTI